MPQIKPKDSVQPTSFNFEETLDIFKQNELKFRYFNNDSLSAEFKVVDLQTNYEFCFFCCFNFEKTSNHKLYWRIPDGTKRNIISATSTQFYSLANTLWTKRKSIITDKIIEIINKGSVVSENKINSAHNSVDISINKKPLLHITYCKISECFDMVIRSSKDCKTENVPNDYKFILERPVFLSNYTMKETVFSDFDKNKIFEALKQWESKKSKIKSDTNEKTK